MYFQPYRYTKARPSEKTPPPKPPQSRVARESNWGTIFPLGLVFSGSLILCSQLLVPLLSFPVSRPLLAPTEVRLVGGSVLGEVTGVGTTGDAPAHGDRNVSPLYFLSIPKLGIERAKVKTDTRDPDPRDFLGHYLGSALPGEPGVSFIYGHSSFPWLFDPKNYLTVFSNLPKLKTGDLITISDGQTAWEYQVDGFKTLNPEEIDLGSFLGSAPRLALMTCVPPGTRLKRFFVLASLVKTSKD